MLNKVLVILPWPALGRSFREVLGSSWENFRVLFLHDSQELLPVLLLQPSQAAVLLADSSHHLLEN